jgi:HAD superfamily hydrolase (TIGR01509 family)
MNLQLPEGFLEAGIGANDPDLVRDLVIYNKQRYGFTTILAAKQEAYRKLAKNQIKLVDGVKDMIHTLSERLPLGLATSSALGDILSTLDTHNLRDKFRTILTIENVTKPKPNPEIYLLAAERLGKHPKNCWVFEDSIHGVTAANAAGMNVIGLTTSFHPSKLPPVRRVIDNYLNKDEILAIIFA